MYYFYVLYSKSSKRLYYGTTENLQRRYKEHKELKNNSTRYVSDWKLVYYEAYFSKKDAINRERKVKY